MGKPPTDPVSTQRDLFEAVLQRRGILRSIIDKYSDFSVLDYITTLTRYHIHKAYLPRLIELCNLIQELYGPFWGEKLINMSMEKLFQKPSILTSDHAGVLMYPIYIQGNVLFGLQELLANKGVMLNFFSGLVPLDTASISGGLFLSNTYNVQGPAQVHADCVVHRKCNANIFLYPKKRMRHFLAYDAPGFDLQKIQAGPGRIDSLLNRKIINKNKAEILRKLLRENLSATHIQKQNKLIRQAALVNRGLFKEYFPDASNTELLSFQLEHIVCEWLIRELKKRDSGSPITELLLNRVWRRYAKESFNGINPGCWHFDEQGQLSTGTFLFWGIHQTGQAVKLWEKEGVLVGKHGFSVALDRCSLLSGLSEKRIVPNIFLVFLVMAMECGLACFGGFMQCWYLEKIKQGWMSMLSHFGLAQQMKLCKTIPVQNYITGLTVFVFEREDDGLYLPDGADIIARHGVSRKELEDLAHTTMKESFLPGLPFIYRAIYGNHAKLNHIGISEFLQGTDLPGKIVLSCRT